MKLGSDQDVGFWTPRPPSLEAVLTRIEQLSLKPEFAPQREIALARALKPYLAGDAGRLLAPLEQESELASLWLFCDYYPEDGQLTLIEQLRDVISDHIPEEERRWLDPLKHSYLDLLEISDAGGPDRAVTLRSMGDGRSFVVPGGDFAKRFQRGHILLTRIVSDPDSPPDSGKGILAGCGLVLTPPDGKALYEQARDWEQSLEIASGSLVLGEWQEFAKRYGHVLLWNFADLRFAALADAVLHIRYQTPDGEPYLYAIALYDHAEYRFFAQSISEMSGFQEQEPGPSQRVSRGNLPPTRQWCCREGEAVVIRLTLTSSQLIVECDGPDRLNDVKHRLAATFGFSLHFRGESVAPPVRRLSVGELAASEPLTVVVTPDEDRTLIGQFLEKAYLEWADQPHRLLKAQTPRHAAASAAMRGTVSDLIDEMERNDPARGRLGSPAFNYNTLRGHVGLDEVRS
ncbi:MAG TPA: hypothetical protein VFS39_17870 [Nitrospira sp.]|nr:hypothetical protein [Nitrospira sp.]